METGVSMNGIPRKDGIGTISNAVALKDGSGVVVGTNFGNVPVRTVCTSCRKPIMTQVVPTIGLGTWLIALILIFFPPLCFLPFFISALKDKTHKCPNCGNVLGVSSLVGN
jgi:lipopolysaccharide-induced tumor necrosis factor-alpha factor